eukprot:13883904-Alexandrium_andersonii.AAC.1
MSSRPPSGLSRSGRSAARGLLPPERAALPHVLGAQPPHALHAPALPVAPDHPAEPGGARVAVGVDKAVVVPR